MPDEIRIYGIDGKCLKIKCIEISGRPEYEYVRFLVSIRTEHLMGERVFQLSKMAMIASTDNIEKLRRDAISNCEIIDLDSSSSIYFEKLYYHNKLRIKGDFYDSDRFNHINFSLDVGDDIMTDLITSLRSWF
jgi:hypothetical protein